MPHVLTPHWLWVSETTVWALMNHTIDICREGTGLVRIGPVLSDVEKISLNNQPITQIMQHPVRPGIPCTRERNLIYILPNLEESTFTEKDQNPSLNHSLSSVQTSHNHLSLWHVQINNCLRISPHCQYTCTSAWTRCLCRNIIRC